MNTSFRSVLGLPAASGQEMLKATSRWVTDHRPRELAGRIGEGRNSTWTFNNNGWFQDCVLVPDAHEWQICLA